MLIDNMDLSVIGRIARLESYLKIIWPLPAKTHDRLDAIDKALGIITRHRRANLYTGDPGVALVNEYVGARLRRLEKRFEEILTPAYFWLGVQGEGQ